MYRFQLTLILTVIILTACGGGGGGGSGGSGTKQASLNFAVLSTASSTVTASAIHSLPGMFNAAAVHGQVTTDDLESLKYYITDISICKDMTINGTGYSSQSGCISVYSEAKKYDYDTFLAKDAAQETESFIDLMNASDLARLSQTIYLTNEDIGDYHFGKVDHYRPVKVTASVQLEDDTVVYTKIGTSALVSGSGLDTTYVTQVTDITAGPAQETIVVLPNGGSWFKFEKPFTLTAEDIQNETSFQLKLAFNPEGGIKAYNFTSSNQVIQDEVNNYGIEIPLMAFTPVIYRATETARKESYLFSYTGTAESTYNSFDFRLELYTIEEDDSDSIHAADTLRLLERPDDDSGIDVTQIFRPFSVTASDGATVVYSFINWLNDDFITGFSRGTNVGDTGTATFHVDGDSSITMDVLFRSIETIQADATIDTISAEDLNGRWTGTCTTVESESRKDTYDFSSGRLILTRVFYTDAACADEKERLVQNFDIRLIDKAAATNGSEVKQINYIYKSASLTPKTADRTAELNSNIHCSYNDWQTDQSKTLLGQDNCMDVNANDVIYDIYRVSNSALYRGDLPATSADDRPLTLEYSATASYIGDIPSLPDV